MIASPRPRVLAIAAAGLLLVVLLGVAVAHGLTLPIDVAIIRAVRDPGLVAPLAVLQPITQLGGTPVVAAVAIAVAGAAALAREQRLGLAAALTIGLVALVNGGIKRVVDRTRPDLLPPILAEAGYSFPSGQSASAMVAYGIVAVLVSRLVWLPRWVRSATAFVCGVVVGLVGLSRIYLGVHFPSDVLGGWLLGGIVVLLFAELTRTLDAPRGDTGVAPEVPGISPGSKSPGEGAADVDPAAPRSGPPAAR
jgi:undecaprenyl-diphosphatase